jgi:hypothetical protein
MSVAARWLVIVFTACSVARAAMVCEQVVCTTESGHCAIEAPHQPGHCRKQESPADAGRHDSDPCEDRPAAGGLALQAPHRPVLKGDALGVLHASPLALLPVLPNLLTAAPTPAPSGPPAEQGHLRTIVLLI